MLTAVRKDEAKPRCERCLKGGFNCLGYARATQWRHTVTALPRSVAVSTIGFPVPHELSLVAFQDNLCTSHMFDNFVWRTWGNVWLRQANVTGAEELAAKSVRALSLNFFGRSYKQTELEVKGNKLYGECLKMLAGEVGRGEALARSNSAALLVPMLVLLMYSVGNPSINYYLGNKSADCSHASHQTWREWPPCFTSER